MTNPNNSCTDCGETVSPEETICEKCKDKARTELFNKEHPMMQCGHRANATCKGKPCCVICAQIHPGAYEIDEDAPSLEGRRAKCGCCGTTRASTDSPLAFFKHCPDKEFDEYYCGCYGWD